MVQRSLVTVLAALGAVLIVLGGILGFLLSLGNGGFGERFGSDLGAATYGAIAVILGLLILLFSGYTQYRGPHRSLTGGIVLIVLGVIGWSIVGGWVLVAIGSVLTLLAGLILTIEALLGDTRLRSTS